MDADGIIALSIGIPSILTIYAYSDLRLASYYFDDIESIQREGRKYPRGLISMKPVIGPISFSARRRALEVYDTNNST